MSKDGSDVIDALLRNKRKGKVWTFVWVGLFCIIGVGIVSLFFDSNNFNTRYTSLTNDTLTVTTAASVDILAREDSLVDIASLYMRLRTDHDAESIDKLYADTLQHYFKYLKNADKSKVKSSDEKYWKKFAKDKFTATDAPMVKIEGGIATAYIKGRQCTVAENCKDEIVEIVFDEDNKIKAVRAYYQK